MVARLALAAWLSVTPLQAQESSTPTGAIRGVVHGRLDMGRTPLASALVEATAGERRISVLADSLGVYHVGPVPAGRIHLKVMHAGHDPMEFDVIVPAGGILALDVDLQGRPVVMEALTVVADRQAVERAGEAPRPDRDLAEVDLRAMAAGSGLAETGMVLAARSAVGDDPGDPGDILFMRGSTTDLKLVLLDGAPVYAPFHVGGLLPTFDQGLMGTATHYVGGAPARYDGGLSYILDLNTRTPRRDRLSAAGALDLISARASVDAPLGDWGGLLVGGRALHGAESAFAGGESPYGYRDGLARLEVDLTPGHRLSATGFLNEESVFLDLSGTGTPLLGARSDARWGNRAGSVSYRGKAGRTDITLRVAGGQYDARLPISRASGDLVARGSTGRGRVTADLATSMGTWELRYGASAEGMTVAYDAGSLERAQSVLLEDAARGTVAGGYAEASVPVADRLRVWTGLRVDRFSTDGSVRAAPRIRFAWLLSDEAVLTLAAGRYHQYARASDEAVEGALVGMVEQEAGPAAAYRPLLPVATASHLVVSLDQVLLPGLRLGLDGYFKAFDGVTAPGERFNASGADLRVQHGGDALQVWLGYSLAWYWSQDGPGTVSESFTGQHLLTAGVTGQAWDVLGVDLRLGYGDGLPLTAVPVADGTSAPLSGLESGDAAGGTPSRQAAGLPLWSGGSLADRFFRLDAEVSGLFETRVASRPLTLRPYLRLMNALGRRDAMFYYFEPWRGEEVEPLVESALLPVIGFEWRF